MNCVWIVSGIDPDSQLRAAEGGFHDQDSEQRTELPVVEAYTVSHQGTDGGSKRPVARSTPFREL